MAGRIRLSLFQWLLIILFAVCFCFIALKGLRFSLNGLRSSRPCTETWEKSESPYPDYVPLDADELEEAYPWTELVAALDIIASDPILALCRYPTPERDEEETVITRQDVMAPYSSLETVLIYLEKNFVFKKKQAMPSWLLNRLFVEIENHREFLPYYLNRLPKLGPVFDRIKQVLDREEQRKELTEYWRERVRLWLMTHSGHLRKELIERAQNAINLEKKLSGADNNLLLDEDDMELYILAKIDWKLAQGILFKHAQGNEKRTRALALSILYRNALEETNQDTAARFRLDLQEIAVDIHQPVQARRFVCEALFEAEWPGLEDWYVSLFSDASLSHLVDGHFSFNLLKILPRNNPDK